MKRDQSDDGIVKAAKTPMSDLVRQAGVFLIEHASHGVTVPSGVIAECSQCFSGIHYPMGRHEMPMTTSPEEPEDDE